MDSHGVRRLIRLYRCVCALMIGAVLFGEICDLLQMSVLLPIIMLCIKLYMYGSRGRQSIHSDERIQCSLGYFIKNDILRGEKTTVVHKNRQQESH